MNAPPKFPRRAAANPVMEVVPRPSTTGSLSRGVDLTDSLARARALSLKSKADNTVRAYESSWEVFTRWCATKDLHPGGPQASTGKVVAAEPVTIVLYMTDLAEGVVPGASRKGSDEISENKARRPSTIGGHLAAINYFHNIRFRLISPTAAPDVKDQMDAIRRVYLGDMKVKKAPILSEMLPRLIAAIPDPTSVRGLRDKAILLFGFAGGFRRSELTDTLDLTHAIAWKDLTEREDGIIVFLRKTKTDQTGKGREVGLMKRDDEMCPVKALAAWRRAMEQEFGSISDDDNLFVSLSNNHRGKSLSTNALALIVKSIVEAAGFDPDLFAAHSLRSGLVTSLMNAGATIAGVMDITGHLDPKTVLGYRARPDDIFNNHAANVLIKKAPT